MMRASAWSKLVTGTLLASAVSLFALRTPLVAQTPTIADKTRGLSRLDGFIPLYWDPATGKLWMEITRLGEEFLYITGAPTGLGSNDIGLDRGQIGGERIYVPASAVFTVEHERSGDDEETTSAP